MLDELSVPQLREAMAYWELEPFGDEWRQATLVAAILLNANRAKGSKVIAPDELLPIPRREQRQTGRQMLDIMKAFAATRNKKA